MKLKRHFYFAVAAFVAGLAGLAVAQVVNNMSIPLITEVFSDNDGRTLRHEECYAVPSADMPATGTASTAFRPTAFAVPDWGNDKVFLEACQARFEVVGAGSSLVGAITINKEVDSTSGTKTALATLALSDTQWEALTTFWIPRNSAGKTTDISGHRLMFDYDYTSGTWTTAPQDLHVCCVWGARSDSPN